MAGRISHRFDLRDPEVPVACLFLLFAVAFNLYHLYPEVAIRVPELNDGVLHHLSFERAVAALTAGQDPTDPWLGTMTLGYPLFHHYQHLAYLLPALLYLPLRPVVEAVDFLNWTGYLLLSLFPLSIYLSMRHFGRTGHRHSGFSRLAAALAGLVASLLATDGLYGLEYGSYLWRGYGLYTQLWGMVLLPLALAQGYSALRTGRGIFWAVLLVAATAMAHLLFGYIVLVSLALWALLPVLGRRTSPGQEDALRNGCQGSEGGLGSRAGRLVLVAALVGLATAYFFIPFVRDSAAMNRSVWEEQGKYDAYGYEWTLGALAKGQLFDFGRFPALTLLAGAGLVVCLWRWREERYRAPVAFSLLWLLLYFGRPTWGVLLDLLPLGRYLHLHRLIAGVHLGGIILIGLGLALPWQWALARRRAWGPIAAALLTVALLYPVYRERGAYLGENARMMEANRQAIAAEEEAIADLVETLRRAPPGRVYAGRGGNWGNDYRVGDVPVYALLQSAGLDMLGYLYHALSLNADVQVLFDESRPEQYDLFNVRYVVAPAGRTFPAFVRPVGDFGRHRLYEVATSGYFGLVDSGATLAGDPGDFYPAASHWLASDLPRVGEHPALLVDGGQGRGEADFALSQAREVIPLGPLPLAPPRGRIVSETVASNGYAAAVEVERGCLLMLKATYHPNWHAWVDGVEVDTVMLMPSYVGVQVSPGAHQVRLEYRSGPLRPCLLGAGLLVLALLAVAEWRREDLARGMAGRMGPAPLQGHTRLVFEAVAAWPPLRSLGPHLPYLGVLALMVLLAGLPLLQLRILDGHDALEYLPRAVEFYEGLKAGQVFPRWAPDLSGGYGQPFFSFNPPLFYYLSALFHGPGLSFVAAQNLACYALLGLAGLGMYLLGAGLLGRRGGLVAAVAYLFAPYLLATLYVRHALADLTAFASLPFAFWGLHRFAQSGRPRTLWAGALAAALLLLSSNPVALMAFPALLLLAVWTACAERSGWVLLRGLGCLALGLGLAATFWLPALVERDLVQVSRLLEGYLSYRHHFVYPLQFIYSPWGYGLSLPGPQDGMSFALGPVHLLLALVALLFLGRVRGSRRRGGWLVAFFLLLLLAAAFLASQPARFLWDRLPLLQYLEFPWRTLSLAALSSALLCGFPFLLLPDEGGRLADGLAGVLIAGLFLLGFPHARPEAFLDVVDADYSPERIAAGGIAVTTAREYEPVWVEEWPPWPAAEPLTLLAGEGRVVSERRSPALLEARAEIEEPARLRANLFYFPGWRLTVDGVERPVEVDEEYGVIEFPLERGEHRLRLAFGDTPVRWWSTRLSWLSLLVLLLAPWGWNLVQARACRSGEKGGCRGATETTA